MIWLALFLYLSGALSTLFWGTKAIEMAGLTLSPWRMAIAVVLWPLVVPIALLTGWLS